MAKVYIPNMSRALERADNNRTFGVKLIEHNRGSTSLPKEVMFPIVFLCLSVRLSVCLFVSNITQKVMNGL